MTATDNAIEATEKVKNNEKIIKFRLLDEDKRITVSIRNPVFGFVKIVNNKIVTTKSNKSEHGIGMINIENVVEKYHGDSIYSCRDGFFTYTLLIKK